MASLYSFLWIVVIALLTTSHCVTADVTTDKLGPTIQRMNYGVLFKEDSKLVISQEYWLHTFHIELPKRIKSKPLAKCMQNSSYCQVINNVNTFLDALHVDIEHHISETVSSIKTLIPQSSIHHRKRTTRSLLPFIGSLSKGLFGTATMDDVNLLARHINELNKRTSKLAYAMEQHGKHLSSFMSMFDKRTSNLMQGIKLNSMKIDSIAQQFAFNMQQMEYAMSNVSIVMLQQVTKSTSLRSNFNKLLSAVESLVEGKISPFIISKHTLNKVLMNISKILKKSYKRFYLTHTNPSFYYSKAQFLYTRSYGNLYVAIKFPVSTHKAPMQLYRVISLPVPVNKTSSHATQLLSLPPYVALTPHHDHYVPIQSSQLINCLHGNTILCNFNIPLIPITVPDCTMALFSNNVQQVKDLCDFRFVPHLLTPNIVILSPTSVLLYNVKNLALDCPYEKKVIPGCTFCVFHVPCKCSLSTNSLFYSPRLVDCYNSESNYTIVHPVNLALLQQFFDDSKLENIFGHTTFSTPVNLSVPEFQFFNHSFSGVLANDQKYHLSPKKMSKAARKDQVIFSNLAEPVIDGEITLPASWPDTNSILIFVTMGVAVISLAFCVLSFFKMRKMAIALLALQQAMSVRSDKVPSFIYEKPTNIKTVKSEDTLSETLNIELSWIHAIVIISSLVLVLLITCIYLLYRMKRNNGTTLVLEITNGSQCVTVPIMHLSLCPSYWTIHFTRIRGLDVSSFPSCNLLAVWSPFTVTNKATKQTISAPHTISISYWTYYKLSKIFNNIFVHMFLLFTKIFVHFLIMQVKKHYHAILLTQFDDILKQT